MGTLSSENQSKEKSRALTYPKTDFIAHKYYQLLFWSDSLTSLILQKMNECPKPKTEQHCQAF